MSQYDQNLNTWLERKLQEPESWNHRPVPTRPDTNSSMTGPGSNPPRYEWFGFLAGFETEPNWTAGQNRDQLLTLHIIISRRHCGQGLQSRPGSKDISGTPWHQRPRSESDSVRILATYLVALQTGSHSIHIPTFCHSHQLWHLYLTLNSDIDSS